MQLIPEVGSSESRNYLEANLANSDRLFMEMNTFQTLGKPTRRGIKKCNKCGIYNGTKSMVCKNKECDMIFKDSSEKKKIISDAVQLITLNIRKLYSVRITQHNLDNRGFVQLPLIHSLNVNTNNQFNDVALCFVDNCPRIIQNSFSSISYHSCQHISASVKSHSTATPLPVKLNSILKLKASSEIKEKLWILANEKDIPLVQRVSKNVMVVRCQVTPKHPLGYLHFTISGDRTVGQFGTYFCDCLETAQIYKCIHFYLCVCALASEPKYSQEFKNFINMEIEEDRGKNVILHSMIKPDCDNLNPATIKRTPTTIETVINTTGRRKKTKGVTKSIVRRKIWPKIYPIQINILNNNKEENHEETNPIWTFNNWLSFVVESMNNLMTFENAGGMNSLIYNIPWDFYKAFRNRIPPLYLVESQSPVKYELLQIMNIGHVKQIFHNSKVKLKVSKRFILSDNSVYMEIDEDHELSGEMMHHFIYFLNVGQLTVDDSDNTNNFFTIEWIQNFDNVGVGQLKLEYKYGRKCL